MSFVRVGRPQQHTKGKRPVRPKKAAAQRREWVSTVNDLSVHKLTPAELSHRHEIHKSHNKAAAQWELKEKALKRRLMHAGSPAPLDQASLSIIREVFSDQLLLQDVLARSDKALAVVKDLFGDAPRRHTGHPRVTVAPNCDSDSELPVLQRPDRPTHLSLLSQSMMDQEALNELEASKDYHTDDDARPSTSSEYRVIRRVNVQKMKAQPRARVSQQHKGHHHSRHHGDKDNSPVTPCTSDRAPAQTALNATVAVQRVRSRQSQSEDAREETSVLVSQVLNSDPPQSKSDRIGSHTSRGRKCVSQGSELDGSSVASLSGDQSSLGLLQAMLGQVESDLDALSPDTAPTSAQSPKKHRTQSLTGFSVALVSTLGHLVHILKKREDEAQQEAQERRKLEEELKEQQRLIDALTAETMTLREEATALQQRTAELERKLDAVVLAMGGLGLLSEHSGQTPHSEVKVAGCQSATGAEQVPVSSAVLLSPPQQRDHFQHVPATYPVKPHQQLPAVDLLRSYGDLRAHISDSSLSSLPLVQLPSASSLLLTSDPLRSQRSLGTVLAEIAQLSRETDLIRAQLSQEKGLGSGVRESLDSGNERRGSSCSSTGSVTPQSAAESRMSGSSCKERRSQHVWTPEEQQLTQQATSPNTFSANSVEQRLLELNRQSAAARGRLLEIIEQQKQSVSARVSPSVSPIPASAFSPNPESTERLEASELLPEWELRSHSGGGEGERRFAGSDASSHSFGRETRDGKTQMDKERAREGWFALSAHVRGPSPSICSGKQRPGA
ncbi:spindle and centriole-associated protein 1 isoform X2 [Pelmatolapia mariae]|uniref:spindle and centriole-associated protein 1 isoform X2 n=1 Tax=Pelmatolapia mariae TaxID=158779 RepID=UPI002FE55931